LQVKTQITNLNYGFELLWILILYEITNKQDHQALLKAKYYPRVAAASCTQKIRGY